MIANAAPPVAAPTVAAKALPLVVSPSGSTRLEEEKARSSTGLEPEKVGSSGDLVMGVVRRKWIILLCLAVGGGVGHLRFLQMPPVFETKARILIIKEDSSDIPVEANRHQARSDEDSTTTQMILLRSPVIVAQAVKKHGLASLPIFADGSDPIGTILGGLTVSRADERTSALDLAFTCGGSRECQIILKAIIESYEDFLQETHADVSRQIVDLIEGAKKILQNDLHDKETKYSDFRDEAPLIWIKDGSYNIHQARLSQIERARSDLIISESQIKAELQALEAAIKRGGSREAIMLMVDKSPPIEANGRVSAADILFPLLLEEQMLLDEFGADHPKIKSIRKRIGFTRSFLRSNGMVDFSLSDETLKKAGPTDFVTVYLESLRENMRAIDEKQKQLDDLFREEADEARKLSSYEVKDETLRHDIARTNQLFEGFVKRLEEINLIQDNGKMTTRVLYAPTWGWQVAPVMSRIVGFAGVMGFFVGCAIAALLAMADKPFRSPEEITDKLGVPVIGHIPFFNRDKADESSPIAGSICVYHQPKSKLAEAYRGIRTALYFGTRAKGQKVIQVSSPNPNDGKSTMAANLAVAVAQSGKRTLIFESDFRRPCVHKLFGIDRKVGVTSVISGESELSDAIQETGIENLYALSCGPEPPNPSELVSSARYAELIELLREQFDYVFIDTPPLMAVTDPSVVATRVDGILMTIRISTLSQQDCVRSAELLSSLGANLLGVIVNGVDNQDRSGGYGYGDYRQSAYRTSPGISGYGNRYYLYGHDDRYTSYYGDDDEPGSRSPAARAKKALQPPLGTGSSIE